MLEKIQLVDYRYLLQSDITYNDLPFTLPATSVWANIWQSWCQANYKHELPCQDEIFNQTLWLNSKIRIGDNVAYNKQWITKNIKWIHDIVKGDGPYTFLTKEEIEEKYECHIPFMEYYGLLSAIPKEWKKGLTKRETTVDIDQEDY